LQTSILQPYAEESKMAKVFVSYSRKDTEFAKKLTGDLQKNELEFWIDREGIPPTVDWWREIEKGIEEADVFLFIISPDSATSKICGQEIDTAVKNGLRVGGHASPFAGESIGVGEEPKREWLPPAWQGPAGC
jgi:hypothetical protein